MEQVKIDDINPYVRFAKLQYQPISFVENIVPHDNAPDWRLFIIENGRTGICIDGERISASKNTLIIIPPKTPYYFFKQTNTDDGNAVVLLRIFNFDLFIDEKNKRRPPLSPTLKETQETERYENVTLGEFSPFFIGSASSKVKEYLDDLRVKKSLEQNDLDTTICSCLLKLALLEVVKNPTNEQDSADIVSAITTYVASNISKNFKIKQMADDLFFHPFYISKVFKSAMHISLHEYIISERLLYAKNILTNTDDPIEKISSKSGFVNVTHFCKQFNKYFSISPSKYREQNKHPQN